MSNRVGAVLLAAGESRRFGEQNKLLVEVDGKPVVSHALGTLLDSGVAEIVAVVGHESDRVSDVLGDVETQYNPAYAEGQSTSVAVGVEIAREREWNGTLFMLGDMPFVNAETVAELIRAYRDGEGTILAPSYKGKRGNPALFDATHYDALAGVSGDAGGRELVREHGVLVPVADAGVCRDIDRVGDLDLD